MIYEHIKLSTAASVCSVQRDTRLQYAPQDKTGFKHRRGLEGNGMPGAERAAQFHHAAEYMPRFPVLGPEESQHLQQWQEQNYCRTRVV